jgi:hypothetical protein
MHSSWCILFPFSLFNLQQVEKYLREWYPVSDFLWTVNITLEATVMLRELKHYLCLLRHSFPFFQFNLLIHNVSVFIDQSATQICQKINEWKIFKFVMVQKWFPALPFGNVDNTSRKLASHYSFCWLLCYVILGETFKEVLHFSLESCFLDKISDLQNFLAHFNVKFLLFQSANHLSPMDPAVPTRY